MAGSPTAGPEEPPSRQYSKSVDFPAYGLFHGVVTYDAIIRNGRWFGGAGSPSAIRNLGIRDGHVVAVTPEDRDETDCPNVIDASGKWDHYGGLSRMVNRNDDTVAANVRSAS